MNPAEFQPQYDNSVVEFHSTNPGNSWPINPQYCLMPSSARVLASFWTDSPPAVVMLPPITQANGSPYQFNHNVPWLVFKDGQKRNAGQLGTYWGMPGVPLDQAFAMAQLDVATPVGDGQ